MNAAKSEGVMKIIINSLFFLMLQLDQLQAATDVVSDQRGLSMISFLCSLPISDALLGVVIMPTGHKSSASRRMADAVLRIERLSKPRPPSQAFSRRGGRPNSFLTLFKLSMRPAGLFEAEQFRTKAAHIPDE